MPAAAGRGDLRASHADRERVIGTLKAAFVQGRLAKDEFNLRVGRALSARTYADLAALTADIAAVPAAAGSARPPAPALRRPLARAAAGSGSCLVVAFGAVQLIQLADPGATPGPIPKALVGPLFLVLFAPVIAALAILGHGVAASVDQRRSRRRLPPGRAPGTGGQAASTARRRSQRTEAARSRRRRSLSPGSRALRRWRPRGLFPGQRPAITHTA